MISSLRYNHVLFLLRTRLPRKFSSIKLIRNAFLCSHNFSDRQVYLISCDIVMKKPSLIHSLSFDMKHYHGALNQQYYPILEDQNSMSKKAIHSSTGNRSRTISSSTITYKTTTEDVIARNTDMSVYEVSHDKDKKYFFIRLQEQTLNQQEVLAKLEYEWVRPGLVDLNHTEVPPEFQGKGIAKVLAKAAFDAFCEQDVLIRPTCTYLQKYIRENQIPRYIEHLEKGSVL